MIKQIKKLLINCCWFLTKINLFNKQQIKLLKKKYCIFIFALHADSRPIYQKNKLKFANYFNKIPLVKTTFLYFLK